MCNWPVELSINETIFAQDEHSMMKMARRGVRKGNLIKRRGGLLCRTREFTRTGRK